MNYAQDLLLEGGGVRSKLNERPISWVFANHRWPELIDLDPPFQREGGVWSEAKNALLIDSLLRGWDVPKFYFRKAQGHEHFEVVDGKQRLQAIETFRENRLQLGEVSIDLPEPFGDLREKYWKDLLPEQKDRFNETNLAIVELEDADEEDVRQLFLRLQEGAALTPAEKRNATLGELRDFVAQQAGTEKGFEAHMALKRTQYPRRRYQWDDLIAIISCLELAKGPTAVGAVNLRKLYASHEIFDSGAKQAIKRVERNLNFLAKVLVTPTPEMKIKWGFVDLYLLISHLNLEGWVIKDKSSEFHEFFINFELKRLANSSPEAREELAKSDDWTDQQLFKYMQAFDTEGAKQKQLKARHGIYRHLFLDQVGNLEQKDRQRLFTTDQRMVLWRRAGTRCENRECKDPELPKFNKNVHGDHKKSHASGGPTTIENGQCLCGPCNAAKGGGG